MFNRKQAIAQWKKKLQSGGRLEDGTTEEMVSHMEDAIDGFVAQGVSEEEAFNRAARETGVASEIGEQHRIARERKAWSTTRTFLPSLLVSYMKVMVRQLSRQRTHNAITIGGLSIGLASCLLIALYVLHELSYDKLFEGKPIYRVAHYSINKEGAVGHGADAPIPLGPTLQESFPEIKTAVRFWNSSGVVTVGPKMFQEDNFMFVDTAAFRVFGFPLVAGNAATVFKTKNAIAISQSAAKKYFGNADAIGNTLGYQGDHGTIEFAVTGVFKDLPGNTHFSFDFLASINALGPLEQNWGSFKPIWTYVEINPNTSAANLSAKLSTIVDKYMPDRKMNNVETGFVLEPIPSLYLNSPAGAGMKNGGSVALIRVLTLTGVLILLMSCVNFINISLAKMNARLKEIGMRKVFGAAHRQVVAQFVTEVVVALVVSLLIAGLLVVLFAPFFEEISTIHLDLLEIINARFFLVLAAIFLFVVIVAGYAPARAASSFTIQQAFGKLKVRQGGTITLRDGLMFFQMSISGMLIVSALVVNDQITFIDKKGLGVSIESVVAVPYSDNATVFEQRLRSISGVEAVSYSQRLPVNTLNYDRTIISTPGVEGVTMVESGVITPEFIDTYDIKILTGRNFDKRLASDSNKFLVNETTVRTLGWTIDGAIGRSLTWGGVMKGEVIGVVTDYHLESLHTKIQPMVMLNFNNGGQWGGNFISIRLNKENSTDAEQSISALWRELNPKRAFQIVQLRESYRQLHQSDATFSRVIFYFTLVAIFISAIGLYATASYAAEQRRKEVGIRKVLGSSVGNITWKLAAPYLILTALSLIVVIPVAWFVMSRWLSTFAYATTIHLYTLVIAVAIIVLLTIVSVLKESLRAALVNPIRFLREE